MIAVSDRQEVDGLIGPMIAARTSTYSGRSFSPFYLSRSFTSPSSISPHSAIITWENEVG